jgi:hypothetical protein
VLLVVSSVIVMVLDVSATSSSVVAVNVAEDPAANVDSFDTSVIEVGGSDGGGSARATDAGPTNVAAPATATPTSIPATNDPTEILAIHARNTRRDRLNRTFT